MKHIYPMAALLLSSTADCANDRASKGLETANDVPNSSASDSSTPDSSAPATMVNQRIRNEATSLCLELRPTMVAASSCSNISPFVRWDIELLEKEVYLIRPTSETSQCLERADGRLAVRPCGADKRTENQLFRLRPEKGGYHISDLEGELFLTARQPESVGFEESLDDLRVLQIWRLY